MSLTATAKWHQWPKLQPRKRTVATLAEFVRHAEKFGTECVYETACGYLTALELGELALALKPLKRSLSLAERRDLVQRLSNEGATLDEIITYSGLGERQVYRLLREVPDKEEIAA